jgi:hypothetical protein
MNGGENSAEQLAEATAPESPPVPEAAAAGSGFADVQHPGEEERAAASPAPAADETAEGTKPPLRVVPQNPDIFRRAKAEQTEEGPPRGRPSKGGARAVRTFKETLKEAGVPEEIRQKVGRAKTLEEARRILRDAQAAALADQVSPSDVGGESQTTREASVSVPPAASGTPGAAGGATSPPKQAAPTVMGVPLADVQDWAPRTRALAGMLANTLGFGGEFEKVKYFEGTPVEFEVGGNLERDLGQNAAVYCAQRWPMHPSGAAAGTISPGKALAATLAAIALPAMLPRVMPFLERAMESAKRVGETITAKVEAWRAGRGR